MSKYFSEQTNGGVENGWKEDPNIIFTHELPKSERSFYPIKYRDDTGENTDSVWLRSCEEEVTQPITGKISGTIPKWLNGSLIRNGPGRIKIGEHHFDHLFDGSAFLHKFEIRNGRITYQSRFVQTDVYKSNMLAKRIVLTEFGTKAVPDPCQTIFQRISSVFQKSRGSDNSMVSVYPFDDEIYAVGEFPSIHRINVDTLETEERVRTNRPIAIVTQTSHPHVVSDGSVYNLGLSVDKGGPSFTILCYPSKPKDKNVSQKYMFENCHVAASIPCRWKWHPSYMHSFGITDNYLIVIEQPLGISAAGLYKNQITGEPFTASLRWYKNEMTQIDVLDRKTGSMAYKFFSETFFFFHTINQYEQSDHLVLDVCIYRDPEIINSFYTESLKNMQKDFNYAEMIRCRPARFVMPLKAKFESSKIGKNLITLPGTKAKAHFMESGDILLTPEKLCELGCEMPRINYEKFLGKPYRYFYSINFDRDEAAKIIKVDVQNKVAKVWTEENCYPSEPVFIPSPDAKDEDDGVLLSSLLWGQRETNRCGLLVLDAKTFTEIGRTEFRTPSQVPNTLHGWFVADAQNKL